MNAEYIDVNIILDTSFPSIRFREETERGFNCFIESLIASRQKIKVSLTEFNDFHYFKYKEKDPLDVPEQFLYPGGNRSTIDALGKTIKDIGYRLDAKSEEEKPNKVIVILITSGINNCSCYYNLEDIQKFVKIQQDTYNWKFISLCPDMKDSLDYGFPFFNTLRVSETSYGIDAAFRSLIVRFKELSIGAKVFFTEKDREAQTTAKGVFSRED